jgi:hypothetical protein
MNFSDLSGSIGQVGLWLAAVAATSVGGYFIACFVDDALESFQEARAGLFTRDSWWALIVADFGTQHMIMVVKLAIGAAVAAIAGAAAQQAVPNILPLARIGVEAAMASLALVTAAGQFSLIIDILGRIKSIFSLSSSAMRAKLENEREAAAAGDKAESPAEAKQQPSTPAKGASSRK